MENNDLIPASSLEIFDHDGQFALAVESDALQTSGGNLVMHRTEHLLDHMISEFDGHSKLRIEDGKIVEPKFLGAYSLFSIQKDWIELRKDELSLDFAGHLAGDPTLHRVAGPEAIEQIARWQPVTRWLGELGLDLPSLPDFWDDPSMYGSDEEYQQARAECMPPPEFVDPIKAIHDEMRPEQRAVVMMLMAIHHRVVLFPMALVLGKCTAAEYALGVMAAHAMIADAFGDVKDQYHREAFQGYRDDATRAMEYLAAYRKGLPEAILEAEIEAGENERREFKSTLRWHVKAERNDEVITHAVLKTIAAFLNSDGGTLLIGVADDGSIVGVEQDGFPNADKFLLHLYNVIKSSLGEGAAALVEANVYEVGLHSVCRVVCRRSPRPVFLRTKQGGEEFFVRTGPSTTKLSMSSLPDYVSTRFQSAAAT